MKTAGDILFFCLSGLTQTINLLLRTLCLFVFTGCNTCFLFKLPYKMILVFVSHKLRGTFNGVIILHQAYFGSLKPRYAQILQRRNTEYFFIQAEES